LFCPCFDKEDFRKLIFLWNCIKSLQIVIFLGLELNLNAVSIKIFSNTNLKFCLCFDYCIRRFVALGILYPLRLERTNHVFFNEFFRLQEITFDTFKSMFLFSESSEKGCGGGIVWEISILSLFVIFNILCQAYRIRVILILFSIYK